jgi:hypothetical protein
VLWQNLFHEVADPQWCEVAAVPASPAVGRVGGFGHQPLSFEAVNERKQPGRPGWDGGPIGCISGPVGRGNGFICI